jgi:uroporphyrin-III C-methyltransferase/precorrin-2 dehydrogenase/sirohydrochlorin ferrochelatase
MSGFVSLVGAGPGDLELLTLRAVARLKAADLVLYDALVDPEILRLAPQARWFYVGKRAGRKSMAQDTIQRLMIRAARRGERVVRLKCGDPFVFGRGGEEALALLEQHIPFEVVPGVSSALAAPALAGIPVTHRGLSSAFTVVSGHSETAYEPVLSSVAPHSSTIVVLMGLGRREHIAALLLARGWSEKTPAAIVLNASRSDSVIWQGSLAGLGASAITDSDAAGVLIVGAVVELAQTVGRALASPTESLMDDRQRLTRS